LQNIVHFIFFESNQQIILKPTSVRGVQTDNMISIFVTSCDFSVHRNSRPARGQT